MPTAALKPHSTAWIRSLSGLPVASIARTGDKVKLDMKQIGCAYEGTLNKDASAMTGTFTQGDSIPLNLQRKKADKTEGREEAVNNERCFAGSLAARPLARRSIPCWRPRCTPFSRRAKISLATPPGSP